MFQQCQIRAQTQTRTQTQTQVQMRAHTQARTQAQTQAQTRGRKKSVAQSGFTLIEIMVVVAIIAILGAAVVPLIMDRPEQARRVKAETDIKSIASALELYRLDNFNYPSTDQGLEALVEKPTGDPEPANWNSSGYLQKLPKDPWGRDYIFLSPGESGPFDIISLARDGQEGGTEYDADLTN